MRWVLLAASVCACSSRAEGPPRPAPPVSDDVAVVSMDDAAVVSMIDAAVVRPAACGDELEGEDIAPGLRVERIRSWLEPPIDVGDRCLVLVRIDPTIYQMKLLTESEHGERRSVPDWADEFDLVAATNASMFGENGRSTGLMVKEGHVNNGRVNPKFGAYLAFDPVDDESPPVAMFGSSCPGFDLDRVREQYRTVIQNYRLLSCSGSPVRWKDDKVYSAAAVALDEQGRVVFALLRTPYRPKAFAEMLASEKLGLRSAMYVEGGPEASLYARGGDVVVSRVGSYETLFVENDDNDRAWPVPNIIGAVKR